MCTAVAVYEPIIYGFPQSYWLRFWLVPTIAAECKKYTFQMRPEVPVKRVIIELDLSTD